jgi:hypothetical protein
MTPRERNLALVLGGLLFLGLAFGGFVLIVGPLQAASARAAALDTEVADLKKQAEKLRDAVPKLNEAKRRSLPSDPKQPTRPGQPPAPAAAATGRPEASSAKLEYSLLLTRLLAQAKIPTTAISIKERAMDARGIPVLPNTKRPAYIRIAYDIDVHNIDMWEVHDFLTAFYQVDLLHQITSFSIKRDENVNATRKNNDRKDLTLTLTVEAIMLDGAEPRPSLVPVPTAFAAVGGWRGYDTVAYDPNPATSRLVNPFRSTPLLAEPRRDYSYVVLKDMFHGHLPPAPKPSFDRVADVTVKQGEPINPIKLSLKDLTTPGPIKWDVKYESKLLPKGSVKVEPAKQSPTAALTIAPAEGESGSAQVNVTATLADGKELKSTLKVVVTPADPKHDISSYIFLVNTTVRSDGTAAAVIRDRYNPYDYEVRATRDGVRVQKFWFLTATQRKEDGPTTPLLIISDENDKGVGVTATKRVFKVVAVDDDGIIVVDVTPPPAKPWAAVGIPIGPAVPGGAKGFGPGGGPGGKGFGPGGMKPGGQPSFVPLAGAVGAASAILPPSTEPKLYRWSLGKSMRQLTEVPKDEAARILGKAEKVGPVGATVKDSVEVAAPVKTAPVAPMTPPVAPIAAPESSTIPVAPPPTEVKRGDQ